MARTPRTRSSTGEHGRGADCRARAAESRDRPCPRAGGSFQRQISRGQISTGSMRVYTGSMRVSTGSMRVSTGSMRVYPRSVRVSPRSMRVYTGSVRVYTGSVRVYTGSMRAYTGSVRVYTGSTVSLQVNTGSHLLPKSSPLWTPSPLCCSPQTRPWTLTTTHSAQSQPLLQSLRMRSQVRF